MLEIPQQFLALLEKIKQDHNLDLTGYKHSTLYRRINRRLLANQIKSYQDYTLFLDQEPLEYQNLLKSLTIKVSWFFRDPAVFEILANRIWPSIIEHKKQRGDFFIRLWSAGCAGGEEAYSLAILLAEHLKEEVSKWDINILATDIDRESLVWAKRGIYPEAAVREVKKWILDKYFIFRQADTRTFEKNFAGGQESTVRIKDTFNNWISFFYHDLTSDKTISPPDGVITDFDMIVCRNLLMYFSKPLQERVLEKFSSILERGQERGQEKGGHLVLGKSESIDHNLGHQWQEIREGFKIYQKQ